MRRRGSGPQAPRRRRGLLQEREFELEAKGYTATRHQREVGAGYFDLIARAVSGGEASTLALRGSTEENQFAHAER